MKTFDHLAFVKNRSKHKPFITKEQRIGYAGGYTGRRRNIKGADGTFTFTGLDGTISNN
jgi:hypothetical protein